MVYTALWQMGRVERLESMKLFLFTTLQNCKASDDFLHILPGEVPVLSRGWADLSPEKEVLFYLELETIQDKRPFLLLVVTPSKVYWGRGT